MSNDKGNRMEVILDQVPVQGDSTSKKITVEATQLATTVGEIAKSQGLSLKDKNVYVDNSPADKDTVVKAGATLRIAERARGS